MSTVTRTILAVSTAMLCLTGCAREPHPQPATFDVENAWVRASPDSGATTAAYIRFVNGSAAPVTVSRFSSNAANTVELHQSFVDASGESHMGRRDSVIVSPGHTVAMKPGGYHLMLIGTTHPLLTGSMIRIVMHLSDGSIVATSARVRS